MAHSTILEPRHIAIYRKFCPVYDALLDRSTQGHQPLIHRDPHFSNFLSPKNRKDPIYLIDWDSYRYGPAALDVAYLIAIRWLPEKRAQLELPLLQFYHSELMRLGVNNFSFDALLKDYKLAILSMLFLPAFKESIEIPEATWKLEFQCIMEALEDLDCYEAVTP